MIDKTEKWEKDDSRYINTRATDYVLTCINKHNCVTVTGPSGIGKTTLVRHLALRMETNGHTILPVTDAKEIKDHYKSDRKTLYIVDDMCGNFTANQSRIEEWKKSITDIQSILENSKYKLILTCRLQVFQDKGFGNLDIFKTCECNLSSQNLSLTSDEKEKMTIVYFKEHSFNAMKHLGEYEFLPLLCKLYHVEKTNPQFSLELFLNDPFSFYIKDLNHMYNDCKEGKYKYCALFLMVLANNELEGNYLTGKDPKITEIIGDMKDIFDIDENITGRTLKTQVDTLIGTFLTYDEGIYKTIHDKVFDFLAFYFGSQELVIDILIKYAKDRFIRERFVVKDDIESINYLIPISNEKLQMYMKRVFDDIVISSKVNTNIAENQNFRNVKFRTMFLDFLDHLSKNEITAFIEKANSCFLNTMFVMRKKDIKGNVGYRYPESNSFGIVLTDDMLQQYIEKWFYGLIETNSTEAFMENNRVLTCVKFCTALQFYMKHLNQDYVSLCIQTGSDNFLKTMFVIADHDIKGYAQKRNERFGIVITENLLQQYIERIFNDFTRSGSVAESINENRPLMNVRFRTSFRTYIRQLTTEKIASLIQTTEGGFIKLMFVMTEKDIKENDKNRYKCFGIVIPDDLLQQYYQRLLNDLTKTRSIGYVINKNRPLMDVTFCAAFRTYIRKLPTEKIASLIQTADDHFINKFFVMTEDDITENIKSRYERFFIVIPVDLLQQYIQRLFDGLTKNSRVLHDINENRPLRNVIFRTAFRAYIGQLSREKIASLIQTAEDNFVNKMFVMTKEDIHATAENRYECFGIVIPGDMLQQYIERLFDGTRHLKGPIINQSPLMNVTFCRAVRTHMKQLTTEKIALLIQTANGDFINNMFVIAENDIKDNAEYRYECFGIIIPDALLHQYIQRLFEDLTRTHGIEQYINENRPLKNVTFCTAFRTYIKHLHSDKIAALIQTSGEDFFNKMFVMAEDDIKENAENRYECFGIIIPDALLHQYIQRLFDDLTRTHGIEQYINENRPLKNVTFCTAFRTYINNLHSDKIAALIQTSGEDFFNKMFVMAEDDIKENAENRYECIGIIIPNDMLQQYIERLINSWTEFDFMETKLINRPMLLNVTFRNAFRTYIGQLTKEKIASLIQTAEEEFINRMFVMVEEDIPENDKNQYKCFGIVIPDDLLQQYIQRLFDDLTETETLLITIYTNRPFMNVRFRTAFRNYIGQLDTEYIDSLIQTTDNNFINQIFVMTEEDIEDNTENRYEWFGIAIPDNLLQQYMERMLDDFTKCKSVEEEINRNRPLRNATFRSAFRTYLRKLTTEKIDSLIQTVEDEFIDIMFVLTEEEILEHGINRYACFGIIIPDNLLQQYIIRWFDGLTKTTYFEKFINKNRTLKNVTFCNALLNYTKQLNPKIIASLIRDGQDDILNRMFMMSEEDVKVDSKNRYECLGIVIPDDLQQQYIERWFGCLTTTDELEKFIEKNRPVKNVTFRIAMCTYMRQLKTEKIASLIINANDIFFSIMFVMSEDDIKHNVENIYECFGIVIPENLLQHYIERWLTRVSKTSQLEKFIYKSRPLVNVKFRIELQTHLKQLEVEEFLSFFQTVGTDLLKIIFFHVEK